MNCSNVTGILCLRWLEAVDSAMVGFVSIRKAGFLKLGGDRARIQDGGKVGHHGREDLGPVGHHAKHVGHVAALGKDLVVKRGQVGRDFTAVEARDAGHGQFLPQG